MAKSAAEPWTQAIARAFRGTEAGGLFLLYFFLRCAPVPNLSDFAGLFGLRCFGFLCVAHAERAEIPGLLLPEGPLQHARIAKKS